MGASATGGVLEACEALVERLPRDGPCRALLLWQLPAIVAEFAARVAADRRLADRFGVPGEDLRDYVGHRLLVDRAFHVLGGAECGRDDVGRRALWAQLRPLRRRHCLLPEAPGGAAEYVPLQLVVAEEETTPPPPPGGRWWWSSTADDAAADVRVSAVDLWRRPRPRRHRTTPLPVVGANHDPNRWQVRLPSASPPSPSPPLVAAPRPPPVNGAVEWLAGGPRVRFLREGAAAADDDGVGRDGADLVALTHCAHFADRWYPLLRQRGYQGVFHCPAGPTPSYEGPWREGRDHGPTSGVALFWRAARLRCRADRTEAWGDRPGCAVCVLLEDRQHRASPTTTTTTTTLDVTVLQLVAGPGSDHEAMRLEALAGVPPPSPATSSTSTPGVLRLLLLADAAEAAAPAAAPLPTRCLDWALAQGWREATGPPAAAGAGPDRVLVCP